MNKLMVIVCMLLLVLPIVYSVPPTTTVFTGETGINVEINVMESYKVGEERWSVIHLFNSSDGFPITPITHTNITCNMHLRNGQGFELAVVTANNHSNHWDLNGTLGKNNPLGSYAWTCVCVDEDGRIGGYTSGFFEITETGEKPKGVGESNYLILIFVLLITLGLFALPYMVKSFSHIPAVDDLFKRMSWWFGTLMLWFDSSVVFTIMVNAGLTNLKSNALMLMTVIGYFLYPFMAYILFTFIIDVIKMWSEQRRAKQNGEE